MRAALPEGKIHAIMLTLLRRHPVVSFVVVTFAWTWTYVIVFLILFPIPDNPVRTTALVIAAAVVAFATRGRLAYSAPAAEMTTAPAYSTP